MLSLVVKPRAARALLVTLFAFASTTSVHAQQTTTATEAAPTETPEPVQEVEAPPPPVVEPAPVSPTPAAPVVAVEPAAPPPPPPAAPPPAAGPGLKLTSSFFTRYEKREGFDDLGIINPPQARFFESDVTVYRARIGLASTPVDVGAGEQVMIQFTPQATGLIGVISGGVADPAVTIHEGYLRIQGEGHKFDAGRFELNYGDALIIGNLDWHENGRAFDGLRLRLTPTVEKTFVDFFVTQIAEGGRTLNTPMGAGDAYFAGIYAGLGAFVDPAMELEPYFLARVRPGTETPANAMAMTPETYTNASTLFTLGARFKHKLDAIDLRAEGGLQFGGNGATGPVDMVPDGQSIFAYQIDAEVGVSLMDNKLRIGVEGLIASGNDASTGDKFEGWDQLFPTAHKFLGLSDIMGARTNVASGVLHVSASPAADVKLMIDAHVFSRLEETAAMADNSGYAGIEVDTGLVYALGTGLNVRGLYGLFIPGEDVFGADQDPAHYVEIELRHDFK